MHGIAPIPDRIKSIFSGRRAVKLLHVEDDADIHEIVKLSIELGGNMRDVMMPAMTGAETLSHMGKTPQIEELRAIWATAVINKAEP